jgi:hypothetical protein
VSALPKPAGKTSTDLARAAQTAVATMLSASGHSVKNTTGTGGDSGSGGGTTVLLIVLVLAAIAVSTALVVLRVRRSST